MYEALEEIRMRARDACVERWPVELVEYDPPDLEADDLGPHAVILMRDTPEAESLITVAHVLDFTFWMRLRAPLPNWERDRLIWCIDLARGLMDPTRWKGLGYGPKLTDPYAEAELGTAGEKWLEAMVGWQIKVSATAWAFALPLSTAGAPGGPTPIPDPMNTANANR